MYNIKKDYYGRSKEKKRPTIILEKLLDRDHVRIFRARILLWNDERSICLSY